MNHKNQLLTLFSILLNFTVPNYAFAEDIEIYGSNEIKKPNVLFIIDKSGSMNRTKDRKKITYWIFGWDIVS